MALGAIYAALRTLIVADSGTTGLLGTAPVGFGGGPAIYEEGGAPQSTARTYPDLTIGLGTLVPFHRFQTKGWNSTVQIKVTGNGTEATSQAVVTALTNLFGVGIPLTVAGYADAWTADLVVQPTITSTLAGVVTRETPVILRVYAT